LVGPLSLLSGRGGKAPMLHPQDVAGLTNQAVPYRNCS
jgi:hypothetical protein